MDRVRPAFEDRDELLLIHPDVAQHGIGDLAVHRDVQYSGKGDGVGRFGRAGAGEMGVMGIMGVMSVRGADLMVYPRRPQKMSVRRFGSRQHPTSDLDER